MISSMQKRPGTSVPPMFAADEPTSQGPRKDDMPTRAPNDYQKPANDAPGGAGESERKRQ
jgi:hypothetical protein